MNILFWNLQKHNLIKYIIRCLDENDIDIAVFAEHIKVDFRELELTLNKRYHFIEGMGGCEKIALLVKNGIDATVRREQTRYALYTLSFNSQEYVLAGVHLQDRRSADENQRIAVIARLKNDIKNLEESSKCKKTIIVGDLNANPFDRELLQMDAFHAVFYKDVIRKSESRRVDAVSYRRFYNPVLLSLSEEEKNYGSFYYSQGSVTPIWNCYDQILLSRALIDNVVEIKYLKTIGQQSLIANVAPKKEISDHLPLLAILNQGD